MAADPILEAWAQMMKRPPITPEMMVQWKGLVDRSIEAWSRALSEVMATDEFAQLLGASIEQWLAAQASVTGNRAQPLPALAAQLGRIEERLHARGLSGLDDAVDISIKKGIQLVDEQGERMFG